MLQTHGWMGLKTFDNIRIDTLVDDHSEKPGMAFSGVPENDFVQRMA